MKTVLESNSMHSNTLQEPSVDSLRPNYDVPISEAKMVILNGTKAPGQRPRSYASGYPLGRGDLIKKNDHEGFRVLSFEEDGVIAAHDPIYARTDVADRNVSEVDYTFLSWNTVADYLGDDLVEASEIPDNL